MIPIEALTRLLDNLIGNNLRESGERYYNDLISGTFTDFGLLDVQDKATLLRIASGEAYEDLRQIVAASKLEPKTDITKWPYPHPVHESPRRYVGVQSDLGNDDRAHQDRT